MQIERLSYFVEIANCQSLNVASENLHISQQALSVAIKKMEVELGVQVLTRSNKGVVLTDEGEELYLVAKHIVDEWEKLKRRFSDQAHCKLSDSIQVLMSPGLIVTQYTALLAYFRKHYPQVVLSIEISYLEDILTKIAEGACKVGISCFLEIDGKINGTPSPGVAFQPIAQFKTDLIVHKDCPLASQQSVYFTQLKDYTIVLEDSDQQERYLLSQLLAYHHHKDVCFVNSILTCQQMVADNLAVGFAVRESPLNVIGESQIKRLSIKDDFQLISALFFLENNRDDPDVKAIRKAIQK